MNIEVKIDKNYSTPQVIILSNKMTNELSSLVDKISNITQKTLQTYKDHNLYILNQDEIESIYSENGKVYAPFDGNVDPVFPTGHLVGLSDGNGAEVLIHIGVDTVKLEGKGFTTYVSQGDKVKKGDLLVEFDVELLKKEGYDTTVMFITTDTSKDVQVLSGRKEAVKDIAFLTV